MRKWKRGFTKIVLAGLTAAAAVFTVSCTMVPVFQEKKILEMLESREGEVYGEDADREVFGEREPSSQEEQPSSQEEQPGERGSSSGKESSGEEQPSIQPEAYDTVLMEEAKRICGSYFKAGNPSYRLEVSAGGRKNRNQLTFDFLKVDPPGRSYSFLHQLQVFFKNQTNQLESSWDNLEELEQESSRLYQFCIYEDGRVELFGDSEAAGVYFPMDALFMPEVYERPLNGADLLGLGETDLRLLRNQYYAVYGREFKSPELNQYFGGQPWYQKSADGEKMAEDNFTALDKRNIEFIKAAEANLDREQWERSHREYQYLPQAPYKNLLPEHTEIGIALSDFSHTKDMGLYYETPGTISVPIMLTPDQYETVMKEFEEIEVCVDELTGEMAVVKISNEEYGDVVVEYQSEDWIDYCYLAYEPYSGNYYLWGDSDDTRFKRVYEGSVYVLKGAEYEWFYDFYSPMEENTSVEIMEFKETGYFYMDYYSGNQPAFDEKGYIKGLYFFGD